MDEWWNDPRVEALVAELAALTGETPAEALERALEQRLALLNSPNPAQP